MRHRRLAGGLAVAGLIDDQRLSGGARLACGCEKAAAVLDAFEQANDRSGVVVFREIGDEIAYVDVAGITGCEVVRESDAALHALQHRITERTALRDDPDRSATMPHGGVSGHEIQPRAGTRIGEPNTIRPDDTHAGPFGKLQQALLRLNPIGFGGLREARSIDDDPAGSHGCGALDHALHHRPRHAQHNTIRALRQVR